MFKKILRKYLMFKKIFVGLLAGLVNESNNTKCISLSSQKCITHPTLIHLHPNEYSQEFHCYPFLLDVLEVAVV